MIDIRRYKTDRMNTMTSLVDEHLIAGAYDEYKPDKWEKDWVDDTYKNLGIPKEPPGTDPAEIMEQLELFKNCLLYTSPSPRDQRGSRMPSSA